MSDYISRADAIEAVTDIQDGSGQRYYLAVSLVDKIRSLPSAEAEWIPCSERLPDTDVEVLATVDWGDVRIAWLIKGGAWETEDYILDHDEILAWMPLPKPYREDGEE